MYQQLFLSFSLPSLVINILQALNFLVFHYSQSFLQVYKLSNSDSQKSLLDLSSYTNRGRIYIVVARYKDESSSVQRYVSYVPKVSYGCDVTKTGACGKRGKCVCCCVILFNYTPCENGFGGYLGMSPVCLAICPYVLLAQLQ